MYRNEPICIKCLHKHPTALTCQQAKEAQAAARPQPVKVCEGYCVACEADHSGFTCHDFQTMKAKALGRNLVAEIDMLKDNVMTATTAAAMRSAAQAAPDLRCAECGASMVASGAHLLEPEAIAAIPCPRCKAHALKCIPKEAAPQDGSKVKGYRKLSDKDIEQMNVFKALGRNLVAEIDMLKDNVMTATTAAAMRSAAQAEEDQQALRWLAIARTEVQKAVMAACRAVARPSDDC